MWGPDRTKDKLEELTGKAKQAVGKITDNDSDRVEGEDEAFHERAQQAATEGRDRPGNATYVSRDRDREE
jgi:uncharacterized protein YjbJ (UPF0337 family)